MSKLEMPICETCNKNTSIGVCCVPSVPYSAAYCRECLEANAHPYHIMVSGTAINGGLEHCAKFWKEMIECTIKHLNKTKEQFVEEVNESIKQLETYE